MTNLPFLLSDAGQVARQGEKEITRNAFLGQIEALAGLLPDRPYIVNLCGDRYDFAVTWAAAMIRGQVTLLPGSGDPRAVEALRVDYPSLYVLSDENTVPAMPWPYLPYPKLDGATGNRVPSFAPDQIAAVLFTSGSTGRPTPNIRRWGRLVRASQSAGAALGIRRFRGAAVVATIPHAHSYGLESAVMLPLQHGLVLTSDRPFFPADVAASLGDSGQSGILITTPVHLRALVGEAGTHRASSMSAGFVLSATAPLSSELAAGAEAAFGSPVFEIYGCSEAGQLATRRTVEGPVWQCLDGFQLRQNSAGTWASGPDEDDVLLADEIELAGPGAFILQGRAADMVNVAGKRSSLGFLTRQLLSIDGIRDGAFVIPADLTPSEAARLTAIVVAPGLDPAHILASLRALIDPAFLPRPLHMVDRLPRNALGKLPREEILRLIESAPIIISFPHDDPTGPGHFPGNPIIPGALLLDELVSAIVSAGWRGEIEAAKFHHPVRPGDTVTVTSRIDGGKTRFECRLTGSGQLVLSGALRSTPPSP
jgi:acyl-CoA synthetase (AMP-forming)/AMP-acid ligase II